MSQEKGFLGRLLLDYETTFGSDPVAEDAYVMPVNTVDLSAAQNKTTPQTLRGSRNPFAPSRGNIAVDGSIAVPVDYSAMWYWLKGMFGDPATSGVGPYVHVFTVADSQPSMVLEKQFTGLTKYWKYNGCKINSWNLSFSGNDDGELISTFNIMGANETESDTPYDAAPTSATLSRLHMYQVTVDEGGGSSSEIIDVNLNVEFGINEQRVLGNSGKRSDLLEGMLSVSGSITAIYASDTLIDKGIGNTESSLDLTITSGSYSMVISIPELEYHRPKVGLPGPQGITVTMDFKGFYDDDADASVVSVTLTNADAHA